MPDRDGIIGKRYNPKDKLFPYGRCECNGPTCCNGRGPAIFQVERKGKTMRVCTRCDVSSDRNRILLARVKDKNCQVFEKFDPLGFLCVALMLAEKGKDDAKKPA